MSGVLRGRTTLYTSGTIVILDDLRYATDPSTGRCNDILGLLAGKNITVADNAILGPENIGGSTWRNFDDTKDLFIHGVMMAINTSFGVENYNSGPTDANDCEGSNVGRGCLYLTGGVIRTAAAPWEQRMGMVTSSDTATIAAQKHTRLRTFQRRDALSTTDITKSIRFDSTSPSSSTGSFRGCRSKATRPTIKRRPGLRCDRLLERRLVMLSIHRPVRSCRFFSIFGAVRPGDPRRLPDRG